MITFLKTILAGFQILCFQALDFLRVLGWGLTFFGALILMAVLGLLVIGVPLVIYWGLSLWIGVIPALVLIVVAVVIGKSYELGAKH